MHGLPLHRKISAGLSIQNSSSFFLFLSPDEAKFFILHLKRLRKLEHKPARVLAETVIDADVHVVLEFHTQTQPVVGQHVFHAQPAQFGEYRAATCPRHATYAAVNVLAQLHLGRQLVVVDVTSGVIAAHPTGARG